MCMPTILALRSLRHEDLKLRARLGYIVHSVPAGKYLI